MSSMRQDKKRYNKLLYVPLKIKEEEGSESYHECGGNLALSGLVEREVAFPAYNPVKLTSLVYNY